MKRFISFENKANNMNHNVDILSNPKSAFWQLSKPLILLSIFQACYSMVDMFWVSQFSQEAFFAISVSAPLISVMTGFGTSIGTGTNSIISRELGKKDFEGSYNSILHGIVAIAVLSLIFIISTFFLKDILYLMDVKESADLAIAYLTPMFLFSFITLLSSLFVSTLEAEGNSSIPTRLLIFTNILNLILDPILIFVLGLGVVGAAYASILSSLVAVVYFLYWYLSGKSEVILNLKYFKPGIVYDIFVVAIPNFLMSILWGVGMIYINSVLIEQLGEIGVLLYSTSLKLESLLLAPQNAMGTALISICGQLFGANKIDDLKEIYNYVLKVSVSLTVILTVAFFFVRDYGFAFYSVTGVEESVFYIAIFGIFIVTCQEISIISNKMFDGMGKSYYSLILSIGTIILDIAMIALLYPVLTSGVCVIVGMLIGQFIFAVIYCIFIRSILNGNNRIEKLLHRGN